jgi:hypothetical protein
VRWSNTLCVALLPTRRSPPLAANTLQTRISAYDTPGSTGLFLTRQERFELPTFGSVDRRSIQLSYWRKGDQFSRRAGARVPGPLRTPPDSSTPSMPHGTSSSSTRCHQREEQIRLWIVFMPRNRAFEFFLGERGELLDQKGDLGVAPFQRRERTHISLSRANG